MTGRSRARLRATATIVATLAIGLTLAAPAAVADPPDGGTTPTSETSTPTETGTPTESPTETSTPTTDPSPTGNPAAPEQAPAQQEQRQVAAAAARAEAEVTGEFDKASYNTGDLITFKLRLKNVGSAKADGLFVTTDLLKPTDLRFGFEQLGELKFGAGASLEPGATIEKTLSGHLGQPDADIVTLTGNVFGQDGFGVAQFAFSAPVKKVVSHVAGTVFGDKNGNGKLDSGEELSGATLTFRYADGGQIQFIKEANSGPGGTFDLGEIPTVRYAVSGQATGFVFSSRLFEVDAAKDNTKLLIRASAPLQGALKATMEFTKDSYQLGELAHVKITLSNSGSIPIVDIVTGCNRSDEGPQLRGFGPGWAALDNGVTLAPGETKVFDVAENVPEKARNFGYVLVSCDFGIGDDDIDEHAFADDTALVATDARVTLTGEVSWSPNGPQGPKAGLAGVRAVLVADGPCPILGDTVTDAQGKFEFTNLTPGPGRKLYLVPPSGFQMTGDNPTTVDIIANRNGTLTLDAEQGTKAAPAVPTQPASCTGQPTTPAPQGRSDSGLASTGASVIGLTALGALALLVGAASVVVTRRRRKTAS